MSKSLNELLMDWSVHADVFPVFGLPANYSPEEIEALNEWARQAAVYLRAAVDHIEDQEPPPASAIDARSAETGTGSVHESAARRETHVAQNEAITKAVSVLRAFGDDAPIRNRMEFADGAIAALTALQEQPAPVCPVCFGAEWVDEANPDKPWKGVSGHPSATDEGPGMPCVCSPMHESNRPASPAPDPRLDEWEKLANAATPGPWDIDTINVDGSYGSGDAGGECYNSYEVHSADGKCLFDAINSDAAMIDEECDEYGTRHAWDEIARQNLTFVAAAREAIPALIEMVRENDRQADTMLETLDANWVTHQRVVAAEARATAAEADAAAARKRVRDLEKALVPFADIAEAYDPPDGDDDHTAWDQTHTPTLGMLRAARAALGRQA